MDNITSLKNPIMTLITKAQMKKLTTVGYENTKPIIKLFMGPVTWLVTCIDEKIAYGYADIGFGCVEFGSLCHVEELSTFKVGPAYLERDRYFTPEKGVNYLELESLTGI